MPTMMREESQLSEVAKPKHGVGVPTPYIHRWKRQSSVAHPEFARTWILVLGPSPPEPPPELSVSVDLTSCLTFVAAVPRRKNVPRRVKGRAEGWKACMVAEQPAVRSASGVRLRRR